MEERWICENCESIYTGGICPVCGAVRSYDKRPDPPPVPDPKPGPEPVPENGGMSAESLACVSSVLFIIFVPVYIFAAGEAFLDMLGFYDWVNSMWALLTAATPLMMLIFTVVAWAQTIRKGVLVRKDTASVMVTLNVVSAISYCLWVKMELGLLHFELFEIFVLVAVFFTGMFYLIARAIDKKTCKR